MTGVERKGRDRRGTTRRLRLRVLGAALAGGLVAGLVAWLPEATPAGAGEEDGFVLVGKLPTDLDSSGRRLIMMADTHNNLGLSWDSSGSGTIRLSDLTEPGQIAQGNCKHITTCPSSWSQTNWPMVAADTKRQLLYVPPEATVNPSPCNATGASPSLRVIDYAPQGGGARPLTVSIWDLPCTGSSASEKFYPTSTAYHAPSDSVVMSGFGAADWPRFIGLGFVTAPFQFDKGTALLIRSSRPDPERKILATEWEIDLRGTGCGRWDYGYTSIPPFVARIGNDILTVCHDTSTALNYGGEQGYLVRVPLAPDPADGIYRPIPLDEGASTSLVPGSIRPAFRFFRSPLVSGQFFTRLDPVTGNILLVTSDKYNGRAVWVYNPYDQRFVGAVTGGYAQEPRGNTAIGFDEVRGRVYLLTQHGLLSVSVRQTPLPGGELYPVMVNSRGTQDFMGLNPAVKLPAPIQVFPRAGRDGTARLVFLAPKGAGEDDRYWVFEDRTPQPAAPEPADPDLLTSSPEALVGRKTEVSASGRALASGARLLVPGGVARTITQRDPACELPGLGISGPTEQIPTSFEQTIFGECVGSAAVAGGHRDVLLAPTEVEAGTGSGVVARAAGQAFGAGDTGDDGDLRRTGGCHIALFRVLTFNQANPADYEQYAAYCDQFWNDVITARTTDPDTGERHDDPEADPNDPRRRLPDPREGTAGRDGQGFPLPRTECTDFGSTPTSNKSTPTPQDGAPEGLLASAQVTCQQDSVRGEATGAFSLAAPSDPNAPDFAVARAWSSVSSRREGALQVTRTVARAEGIRVGPISISSAVSMATTQAGGLPKTARTDYRRWVCGIRFEDVDGTENVPGCVDPDDEDFQAQLSEVNQISGRVHFRVTDVERQATKGGYQAVVTKDPAERGADQTVNDDDSPMVAALDVIYYGDGGQGRNRYILQLAPLHSEARYGITALPDYGDFEFPDPGPGEEGGGEISEGPTPSDGGGSAGGDDVVYEEAFGPLFDGVPASARSLPLGRGAGPVQRFLRGPGSLLRDLVGLLIANPAEFALLFVLWSLLATPIYLGIRRRSFAHAVAT